MTTLSESQADVLLHALGLRDRIEPSEQAPYRNQYVAEQEDSDAEALVEFGLMRRVKPSAFIPQGWCCYAVTSHGEVVAHAEHRRRNPPPKPGAARYRRWLRWNDAWEISFGEWLRRGYHRMTDEEILKR